MAKESKEDDHFWLGVATGSNQATEEQLKKVGEEGKKRAEEAEKNEKKKS